MNTADCDLYCDKARRLLSSLEVRLSKQDSKKARQKDRHIRKHVSKGKQTPDITIYQCNLAKGEEHDGNLFNCASKSNGSVVPIKAPHRRQWLSALQVSEEKHPQFLQPSREEQMVIKERSTHNVTTSGTALRHTTPTHSQHCT